MWYSQDSFNYTEEEAWYIAIATNPCHLHTVCRPLCNVTLLLLTSKKSCSPPLTQQIEWDKRDINRIPSWGLRMTGSFYFSFLGNLWLPLKDAWVRLLDNERPHAERCPLDSHQVSRLSQVIQPLSSHLMTTAGEILDEISIRIIHLSTNQIALSKKIKNCCFKPLSFQEARYAAVAN